MGVAIGIFLLGIGVGLVLRVPGLLTMTGLLALTCLTLGISHGSGVATIAFTILKLSVALHLGYLVGLAFSGFFDPRR